MGWRMGGKKKNNTKEDTKEQTTTAAATPQEAVNGNGTPVQEETKGN